MSLTTLFAILASVLLISYLASLAAIRLAAKAVRAPAPSRRRTLAFAAILLIVNPSAIALEPLIARDFPPWGATAVLLGLFLLIVKGALRASWGRTLLAGMVIGGVLTAVAVTVSLGARRCLVEAFQVEAGSMAPTVLGMHLEVRCPQCGLVQPVGVRPGFHPPEQVPCAACGASCVTAGLQAEAGDRILADHTVRLARWDIAAYRLPRDPSVVRMHRLIGLPGETLEILGGDMFIDGKRLVKPPGALEDLWVPLFDTAARPPSVPSRWRWLPAAGDARCTQEGAGWTFRGGGGGPGLLDLAGPLMDASGYDAARALGDAGRPCGDVLVECTVEAVPPEGSLALLWTFGRRAFRAAVSSGGVAEIRSGDRSARAESGRPLGRKVSFGLRDGQAFILAAGADPLVLEVFPAEADEAPSEERGACRLALEASGPSVSITRIILRRGHPVPARRSPGWRRGPFAWGPRRSSSWATIHRCPSTRATRSRSRHSNLAGVARWIWWPPRRWKDLLPPR